MPSLWKDQIELLLAFNAHRVEYLVIGGHAVSEHSEPRATKDLDLLIRTSEQNSIAVYRALAEFGAPLAGLSPADFTEPDAVFQLGVPPSRVDVMQSVTGVDTEGAWERRVEGRLGDGTVTVYFISKEDLLRNKLATGRYRDLADAEQLQAALDAEEEVRKGQGQS